MASAKILVVDDDTAIRNLVSRFLAYKDYQVQVAVDGQSALEIFSQFSPDLVILDVNLPDAIGYNLCEQMQRNSDVFILLLTSRANVEDKKEGFLKGADDFLTKPFDLQELELRVKAILKRQRTMTFEKKQELVLGELKLDSVRREVTLKGELVTLTSLEFDILYFLASYPGRVWTRQEMIDNLWGQDYVGDHRVVDVHIGQIRKKIEADLTEPVYIQTIRGVGYRFESPPEPETLDTTEAD